MPEKTANFKIERETKNTIRYQEVTEGQPPFVGTIYVQKWVFGKDYPREIKVTVQWEK